MLLRLFARPAAPYRVTDKPRLDILQELLSFLGALWKGEYRKDDCRAPCAAGNVNRNANAL
jgi:hypothetical protein